MIQVLLSTHDGEAWLSPLLASLEAQDVADLHLLVRDDGSSDGTVKLLRELGSQQERVRVVAGRRVGFVRSFLDLLRMSSPDAAYLAFCDQDDVWLPSKLSRAVELLEPCDPRVPALYASRLQLVDETLRPRGESPLPLRGLSFPNALVECPLQGCTMVINQAARRLIAGTSPQHVFSHDWWLYLVVSAFGRVVFDERSSILYRRHAGNVFSTPAGVLGSWRLKIRRFWESGALRRVVRQAEDLGRVYGDSLPREHARALRRFVARRKVLARLRYAVFCEPYRQSRADDLVMKGLILVNRL